MSCPLTVIFVLRVLQSAPSGTISLNSAFSEATLPREDSDWTSQLNRKSQDAALDAVFVSPTDAVRVSLFVSYLKADAGTQFGRARALGAEDARHSSSRLKTAPIKGRTVQKLLVPDRNVQSSAH